MNSNKEIFESLSKMKSSVNSTTLITYMIPANSQL